MQIGEAFDGAGNGDSGSHLGHERKPGYDGGKG
jgi:hypothetical protein